MGKIKLQYKTAEMINPVTKEAYTDRRRAHIVNLRIYNIDELVRFALENNYIEGAKYELAKGIVKGAIEAERALILAGNAVSVDGWVKYEPRLKGSVSAKTRALTNDNTLIVGISALKELKLSRGDFSWQLVDEGFVPPPPEPPAPSTAPTVTKAYPTDHSDDGQYIREGEGFVIDGANFSGAEVAFQTRSGGGAWSEAGILDGDSEYTVNESGTSIDVHRETVNGIITDADLGDNDHVKITISNDDGSASVVRTVMLA